jgi:hypothetical protein
MKSSYQKSDVEEIYKRAHPKSWNDLVQYITTKGDATWHITPGEAEAMKRDFERVAKSNAPFQNSPDRAYEVAHEQSSGGESAKGKASGGQSAEGHGRHQAP